MEDRALKDSKFVKLDSDDDKPKDEPGDDVQAKVEGADGPKSDSSEFSFSEDDEGAGVTTANESRGASGHKRSRKNWNRQAAEDFYKGTRTAIMDRLFRQGEEAGALGGAPFQSSQFSVLENEK